MVDKFVQLRIGQHLLINGEAENPRWALGWMGQSLAPDERQILIELESRFNMVVTGDRLG